MLDTNNLTAIVGLILALSIASERFVEIIKGMSSFLNQEQSDPVQEGRRRSALHLLAAVSGMVTAVLAKPAIAGALPEGALGNPFPVLALGLLASGGSGFWNSVLSYMTNLKDATKLDVQRKKEDVAVGSGDGEVHRDLDLGEERVSSNECYDVEGE